MSPATRTEERPLAPSTLTSVSTLRATATARPRPALFIDTDGTLFEAPPGNVDPTSLRFMPGATEALAALTAAGFALVVVSSPNSTARGQITLAQSTQMRGALEERLRYTAGVELTDFRFCPHAPGPDGRPTCACRKPAPWMLQQAARLHGLDLACSWMVGNTLDAVEAGRRAGCRSVLYDSGGETVWMKTPMRQPDLHAYDWDTVLHHILKQRRAVRTAAPPR